MQVSSERGSPGFVVRSIWHHGPSPLLHEHVLAILARLTSASLPDQEDDLPFLFIHLL